MGSFQCSCVHGYFLDAGGFNCSGTDKLKFFVHYGMLEILPPQILTSVQQKGKIDTTAMPMPPVSIPSVVLTAPATLDIVEMELPVKVRWQMHVHISYSSLVDVVFLCSYRCG